MCNKDKKIKNKRFELRLTSEEKDKLKELAKKNNMTISEFVLYKVFQ